MLVSSLCCSISAVKQMLKCSVSKRCNVMGWACSVFERRPCLRQHQGVLERTLNKTLLPVVILHIALPHHESQRSHTSVLVVLFLFTILHIKVELSPPRLHGDLLAWSGQVMPVYQSRVLTCVLPRGSRVYVQACACPSDIWLCFNTVHELLFCGTWLAWINFVYICTLILFTV